jgi:hypothetical protein
MGKHNTKFGQIPYDLFQTPPAPVLELVPHLKAAGIESFTEPCGDADGPLVRTLEAAGFRCVYAGDIRYGQDALAQRHYNDADAIITNLPYTRADMHELIEHFIDVGLRCFLLIDHAWPATQWSGPFLQHCIEIIPVKRITWFEGTTDTEKRSHCWYHLDIRHVDGPRLQHWRDHRKTVKSRKCKYCRKAYAPPLLSSRFCSSACRQQAYHARFEAPPTAEAAE